MPNEQPRPELLPISELQMGEPNACAGEPGAECALTAELAAARGLKESETK